jgi:anthranilate phosphoribosyltransferase
MVSSTFVQSVLVPLVKGTSMERHEARDALAEILEGQLPDTVVAAFLASITMKGETTDEMAGFVDAMMAAAVHVDVRPDAVDIVGTGGDQLHTVNISTMASLAVAGTGVAVAKHGNRSATSSVGSADVLEKLGVKIAVPGDVVRDCLEQANFGFFFAPAFHPALGNLTPIRRALGFRTVFNVLGPLANPGAVRHSLLGVAQEAWLDPMAAVVAKRGTARTILVSGDDGLDELSPGATSTLVTVTPQGQEHSRLNAGEELGFCHDVAAIRGGDAQDNEAIVRAFLEGQPGPVFDAACANAALALIAADRVATLVDGFELASAAVHSGAAQAVLERLIEITNA